MGDARVVKWETGWKQGDFLAAVLRAGGLAPRAVVEVDYLHADGCPKPSGGPCRCDPEVTATITPAPEAT